MLAAFKLRAVPVNINYRYVERELAPPLRRRRPRRARRPRRRSPTGSPRSRPTIPTLRHVLVVDDGTAVAAELDAVDYEAALGRRVRRRATSRAAAATTSTSPTPAAPPACPRACCGGTRTSSSRRSAAATRSLDKGPISDPTELAERVPDFPMTQLVRPAAHARERPLGRVQHLLRRREGRAARPAAASTADEVVADGRAEGVNVLTVVGDAMARPVLDALAADPDAYDTVACSSPSPPAARSCRRRPRPSIAELLPNVIVIDAFGSSETGMAGSQAAGAGDTAAPRFTVDERTAVLDDDLRPGRRRAPATIGRLARRGHIPLGYHKDEAKTAATFVTDRRRALGAARRHGHAWTTTAPSCCSAGGRARSTPAARRSSPRRSRRVLKGHPGVFDVLVVGVPDERWGETGRRGRASRPATP